MEMIHIMTIFNFQGGGYLNKRMLRREGAIPVEAQ